MWSVVANVGRDEALHLRPRDVVVFLHRDGHAIGHSPQAKLRPADEVLPNLPAHRSPAPTASPCVGAGNGDRTTLVRGHFEFDHAVGHPFTTALPPLIHIRAASTPDAAWIQTVADLCAMETQSSRQGLRAVVSWLAEVLFVQTPGVYIQGLDAPQGVLAALSDRNVSVALALRHKESAFGWSVQELGRSCGASRSHLAKRFRDMVGQVLSNI
jgi:hypothetical protein